MSLTKVTRGSLFVRERNLLYTFMFNPAELKVTKGTNFPHEIPAGGSYPIYNYASGGEHLITFTLTLDGERGRSDNRKKSASSANSSQPPRSNNNTSMTVAENTNADSSSTGGSTSLSVMDEIVLLMGLTFPSQYGRTSREVYPYTCLFNFGGTYKATPVIVKKADPTITMFTAKLEPMRATVEVQLAVVAGTYVTSSQFAPTPEESAAGGRALVAAARDAVSSSAFGVAAGVIGGFLGKRLWRSSKTAETLLPILWQCSQTLRICRSLLPTWTSETGFQRTCPKTER